MKKQIVVIHGGSTYDTYQEYISDLENMKVDMEALTTSPIGSGWKDSLGEILGKDYEILRPEMPVWMNAKYTEWKIWFDKILQFLHEKPVFVGHSLGGIFLAKYFAENNDTKKVAGVFLVAAPFCNTDKEKMADFILPKDLTKLNDLGDILHLYHSEDDPVVAYADVKKYAADLPNAIVTSFKNRGHFIKQAKFPEIVKDIKNLYK